MELVKDRIISINLPADLRATSVTGVKRVKCCKIHSGDSQILGATIENLVA